LFACHAVVPRLRDVGGYLQKTPNADRRKELLFRLLAGGLRSVEAKQAPDSLADPLWLSTQMNKRMDDDATRFDGIKQPETSGTDNKTPYRFFKHWRHFRVHSQMAECEIELADKPHARSLVAFF